MKILVTGGAGYIGSITTAHLLQAGHEVTVLDNLSRGHRSAVPREASFVLADIGNRAALDEVLSGGFEAIVHFAALIEAGESMRQPGNYIQNNTAKTAVLIDAAAAHDVRHFVFSSTAAVYAGQDTPLTEGDPIGPVNVYGQTKRMVEEILQWYQRLHGLNCCVLRYFNASGASRVGGRLRGEAHRPETHLIPIILQVALGQREHISIFGDDYPTRDRTNIRDYIHVDDLARAHVQALEGLQDVSGAWQVYNLGNGLGYSNREVLETARQVTGHPIPAVMAERRPGDAPILIASSDRIRRELGWTPEYPELATIIGTAWEWHRAHPQGYGE